MSLPKILILSAADDLHTEAVSNILTQNGYGDPVVLDLALLPKDIDIYHDNQASVFEGENIEINLRDIVSIWWRRPQRYRIPSEVCANDLVDFCYINTQQAVEAMLINCGKPIVNDPFATRKADHKLYQLSVARKCQLQIPETLVTTDPCKARDFISQMWITGRQVVTKCIQRSKFHYAPTRLVTQDDMELLRTLKFAPAILQERVVDAIELRITIVGNNIFAASCKSYKEEAQVDIRLDTCQDIARYTLPEGVQRSLLDLMSRLQLTYAAIDMFFKPPNDFFFIEINPSGQYLYIEIPTLFPISHSIAQHLTAREPELAKH